MEFRSNTRYRQYDVIREAKENLDNIMPGFLAATPEVQLKLMDDYMYFGKVALVRVIHKMKTVEVYQKNKLFLYPDIELSVYYFYSLKKLYPLMVVKDSMSYLDIEELVVGFCGILEELSLIHYQRALMFSTPYI